MGLDLKQLTSLSLVLLTPDNLPREYLGYRRSKKKYGSLNIIHKGISVSKYFYTQSFTRSSSDFYPATELSQAETQKKAVF